MVLVLCTSSDNALFIFVPNFVKISQRVWELYGHYFHCEIFKGA